MTKKSQLQKHEREAWEAARRLADQHGVAATLLPGGNHRKVELTRPGAPGRKVITISGSPRDRTAMVQAFSRLVRRACQELAGVGRRG